MRYEPEHKTRTRDQIVRNAARKLRAEGLSGPGVATIMKASGLTVGGFYKHFRSKDDLVVDAINQGFSEFDDEADSFLQGVPHEDRWKEIVRRYLSPEHCDHPEIGCPVAALAPEIARAELTVREQVTGLIKARGGRLLELIPGATTEERERNFFVIFSAMAGAISVARILPEAADRQKVLQDMRDHLLRSY
ncbi:TetR/AcrR family transcriptional regulator [Terriglobus sp. RCC_193]|uniref:TetR/AcrR family transcriptional regulator n=1 Tax=Terriglobus sp. RCC_193 TaxID=3239218 RepID=UPI0035260263